MHQPVYAHTKPVVFLWPLSRRYSVMVRVVDETHSTRDGPVDIPVMQPLRRILNPSGRYVPHQSDAEMARRRRQACPTPTDCSTY